MHRIELGALRYTDICKTIEKKFEGELHLPAELAQAVADSHQAVLAILQQGKRIYGINTGFGVLADKCIPDAKLQELQRNLVLSHATGWGDMADETLCALVLLLKLNSLAQGYSGVRPALLERLIYFYENRIYPCIPLKGSVGASGDLVPLAHFSLALIGEGEVYYQGRRIASAKIHQQLGIEPIVLQAKEGLALLNGLQMSLALALYALHKAERVFDAVILAGALSVDAVLGSSTPFDPRIQAIRGHKAQQDVAAILSQLLQDSAIRASHQHCAKVQDPYSLRCQPQVMGAVLQQLRFALGSLEAELNGVTDNPLVFAKEGEVLSGGNFHGEMIAMAADNMALAIAEMGALSERRIALLVDRHFSQLPAFLVESDGLNSGFMIAHVTAAAAASDNKALAHPHSVDSLPTSANQEDHVSMATNAALRLHAMIDNSAMIVAIELLSACQGIDFRRPLKSSPSLETVYDTVRLHVAFVQQDRLLAPDMSLLQQEILKGTFRLDRSLIEA